MERTQIIGFVLIFVVLVAWMWMNSPAPQPVQQSATPAAVDSARSAAKASAPVPKATPPALVDTTNPGGRYFGGRVKGVEQVVEVETDLYRVEVSSRGAAFRRWELKKFRTWNGHPVQLVDPASGGECGLLFGTSDGKTLASRSLFFDLGSTPAHVVLDKNNFEFKIIASLPSSNGGTIVKSYTFHNDSYGIDVQYEFRNLGEVIANYEVQATWDRGVPFAEHNSVDEAGFAAAYVYAGKELTEIDATDAEKPVEQSLNGKVDWVATRNKYFGVALIPVSPVTEGAYLEGHRTHVADNGVIEQYGIALRLPFRGAPAETASVKMYGGPLDHSLLTNYNDGLEKIMSLGWAWVIRPIAEYAFLPLFRGLHYLIPNWGLVIIVFSVLIKLLLHPLTRSSMKSMKKMQALQPLMEEVREKYKDDPAKMNQAVMNLYKEYGVNPAGGCLPMLLQLPIMYALYALFRAAIDLRQAAFVGWIHDLSIPDILFSLPFHLPLFAVKDVSGIALLMGVSMFIQQKMTVKDPRQKMMVWMMPVMLTLLFNSFPAGLNLYYAVFNVLSIGQQMWINRHDDQPLRKVEPKKKSRGGVFGKYAGELQRLKR